MRVSYETVEIRDLLENKEEQLKYFSPVDCTKLQSRVAELIAAPVLFDLRYFFSIKEEELHFKVSDKITLVAVTNHPKRSYDLSDENVLEEIYRVKVVKLIQ